MVAESKSVPVGVRRPRLSSFRVQVALWRALNYFVIILLSIIFSFPLFWSIASSLKQVHEFYLYPPVWLPAVPQWGNFAEVFEVVPAARWLFNSFVVVVLNTVGTVLTATLVAYALARFEFPGRDLFLMMMLGTMMLPGQVTLIPQYVLFRMLGWIDTYNPLWVPSWLGGGAFAIFLLRQFIMSLPRDLDEAAAMDGANELHILLTILVPLMQPAIATIATISFIAHWSEFLGPLIYLNSPEKFTFPIGLLSFRLSPNFGGVERQDLMMAAAVIMAAPCIILFFVAQQSFVQGVVMSGIKG